MIEFLPPYHRLTEAEQEALDYQQRRKLKAEPRMTRARLEDEYLRIKDDLRIIKNTLALKY